MFKLKTCLLVLLSVVLYSSGLLYAEQNKKNVLAVVNGKQITMEDFNQAVSELPPNLRIKAEQNKLDFLQYEVRKELLYQEGLKKGIDKEPRIIDLINRYKNELITQEYLDRNLKDTGTVTDKEVKDYYDKNISLFRTKEEITASHILVKTEKEAKEILSELKKGKDFAEIAKHKSIDTVSARQGGNLGSFSRGTMVPEFEKAAFSLKVGEISPIVKSEFGYHIIKVTDRTKPHQLDFIQVKDSIRKNLDHEKTQKAISTLVDRLVKDAKIEIHEENLR
jgi:peptidyl-prolyl cis-trans isomerase C